MKKYLLLILCFTMLATADGWASSQPQRRNRTRQTTNKLIQNSKDSLSAVQPAPQAEDGKSVELKPALPEVHLEESNFMDDTTLNALAFIDRTNGILNDSCYQDKVGSDYVEWMEGGLRLRYGPYIGLTEDTVKMTDELYLQRLTALPNVIPVSYNQIVRKFIEVYTQQRRGQVATMLGLSEYYFPIFEQALEEYGLPQELKYLPIIESALKPEVTSRAGAAGLWQFIYTTGKIYGLQINSLIDERRDPVKSTYAAMEFLKSLYGIFGDWNLAIAAYNCGAGNVRKAIARSGGKTNFWDIYYYLPSETRSYVPLFIAANYAMTYHKEHGIYPVKAEFPLACDTFLIRRIMHFEQISEVCHIPMDTLQILNPHFRNKIAYGTPENAGTLYIPAEFSHTFIQYEDSIPRYREKELISANLTASPAGSGNGGASVVYRVRSGDTLSTIAKRYHVTIKQLRTWNGLRSDMLRVGQRLVIHQ